MFRNDCILIMMSCPGEERVKWTAKGSYGCPESHPLPRGFRKL
jgi:hypothetical protein